MSLFRKKSIEKIVQDAAVRLAPEWGVPLQDRQMLLQEAKMYTEDALMGGQEDASFFITPERNM